VDLESGQSSRQTLGVITVQDNDGTTTTSLLGVDNVLGVTCHKSSMTRTFNFGLQKASNWLFSDTVDVTEE
jgi:hypothetical protein